MGITQERCHVYRKPFNFACDLSVFDFRPMTVKEPYENKNAENRELRHKQWDPQTFKTSQEKYFSNKFKMCATINQKMFTFCNCHMRIHCRIFSL